MLTNLFPIPFNLLHSILKISDRISENKINNLLFSLLIV